MTGAGKQGMYQGSAVDPPRLNRALVEVWILTAVVTGLRVLAALAVNKIIALRFGPSGMAALGTFQNFTGLAIVLGSAGIGQGTVALMARASGSARRAEVFSVSTGVIVAASLPIAVAILLLRSAISVWLYGNAEFSAPIGVFALLLVPVNLGMSYLNVAAGLGQRRLYLAMLLLVGVATLAVVLPLIDGFRLGGALLAAQVASLLPFVLLAGWFARTRQFAAADFIPRLDPSLVSEFSPYPPMAFATALVMPLVQLAVRGRIASAFGVEDAGIWQGLVKVTESYMMMVGYLMVLVLIPKFSTTTDDGLRRTAVRDAAVASGAVAVLAFGVWIARDLIIDIVLSPRFRPMVALMPAYLLGDVARSAGLVLGAALLARGRVRDFLLAEFAFALTYLAATWLLISSMGAAGATLAYLVAAIVGAAIAFMTLGWRRV